MSRSPLLRCGLLSAAAAVAILAGCSTPSQEIPVGSWRAWLDSPGGELPFGLELRQLCDGYEIDLVNGSERIPVGPVEWNGETLVVTLAPYDATLRASWNAGRRRLVGRWRKTVGPDRFAELPFQATPGRGPRFSGAVPAETANHPASVEGRWSIRFDDEEDPAVGIFRQSADGTVEGTVLTVTGDYRFLAGSYEAGRLRLSCFDGAHAFLFDARLDPAGVLAGDFWSRDNWHQRWSANRDDRAALPDPFGLTHGVRDIDPASLVFPDIQGRPVSIDDETFAGRARLIYLFGSWCPNCNDATRYMVELDRRYRPRGLSIVGLGFEMTGEFGTDAPRLREYAALQGIEFPLLVAGTADKQAASRLFPLVDRIRAYPTTVFLDAQGSVRAVHTGFSGPATGDANIELREQFEQRIEELLDSRTNR